MILFLTQNPKEVYAIHPPPHPTPTHTPRLGSLGVMLGVRSVRHSGNKLKGSGGWGVDNFFLSLAGKVPMELSKPNLALEP